LLPIRYGLRLATAALNASGKSPGPLSLRQKHYRLYRSARGGVNGGAVEVGKIVTRDEPSSGILPAMKRSTRQG
jgi:hypothetical protein